jgi:hypothetical protein
MAGNKVKGARAIAVELVDHNMNKKSKDLHKYSEPLPEVM